jgi:outer membrane receptor protein involved in Fe transport
LASASIAAAQDSTSAGESGADNVTEVVVTGTRLNVSGFITPTPVTVLDSATLERNAPADVYEVMRTMPFVRVSTGAVNTGAGQASSTGQAYIDLRGLTPARSLTLVDGRRTAASASTGTFDVNTLPTSLIERIEVVTGGASAAYGSDAVAGVANFILKNNLEGFSGSVTGGSSEHRDDEVISASLAYGTRFGDRVRLLVGAEASDNNGVGPWYSRDWGKEEPGLISYGNAGTATRAGLPAQAWVNGYEIANSTFGGLITAGPLRGTAFADDGTPYAFPYGTVVGNNMYGTDANFGNNPNSFFNVSTAYRRATALARVTIDLAEDTQLLLQAGGSRSKANNIQNISRTSTTVTLSNPFIPAPTRAAMTAAGVTSITVGRTNLDIGPEYIEQENDSATFLADLSGKLGTWDWAGYYQHSLSGQDGSQTGRRTADINAAFGATTVGGNAQCAVVAGASPGCVPFDIFGSGNASAAAYAYLNQYTQGFTLDNSQDVAEVRFTGAPVSTWAGPLAMAFGADYRKDVLERGISRDSVLFPQGGFTSGNFSAYRAERSVKEAFTEFNVPLLRGARAARALDFNAAARFTSYGDIGDYTTWKAGLTFDPNDEYRFRVTRSRDIRAPTLFEQYGTSSQSTVQIQNLFTGTTDTATFQKGVSLNLKAEEADTFTAGFVFQPHWLDGLHLSVDYFDIRIAGAVSAPSSALLMQGCYFQQIAQYCRQLTFNNAGRLTAVLTETLNADELETSGFDIEAAYRIPARMLGGDLSLRLLATYVDHYQTKQNAAITELAGTGQIQRWKGNFALTYDRSAFSTTAELTGFSRLRYSPTVFGPDDPSYNATVTSALCPGGTTAAPTQCANYLIASNSINQNLFPRALYLNWSAQYTFDTPGLQRLQAFVVVNNVLDKEVPDYAAVAFANVGVYDLIGRYYKAGVRFAF